MNYKLKLRKNLNKEEEKEIKKIEDAINKNIEAIFWVVENTDENKVPDIYEKIEEMVLAEMVKKQNIKNNKELLEWYQFNLDGMSYERYKTQNGYKYYYVYK